MTLLPEEEKKPLAFSCHGGEIAEGIEALFSNRTYQVSPIYIYTHTHTHKIWKLQLANWVRSANYRDSKFY